MIGGDIRGLGTAGKSQEKSEPVSFWIMLGTLQEIARGTGDPRPGNLHPRQLSRTELIDRARRVLRELGETF